MSAAGSDPYCRCGHPQSFHVRGAERCRHGCGCLALRVHARGGIEVLELVDKGKPPYVAPTYLVRCPDCSREYKTRTWLRGLVTRKRCRTCSDALRARKKKTPPSPSRPSDLPGAEAFAHGTRSRYVAGCRCEPCTASNREYARMRQKLARMGRGNPLVDAARVRRHLLKLSAAGVGRRTVGDISGVGETTLLELRAGRKLKLRKETAERILAVGAGAMHEAKLVPAARTHKRIARLLSEGFTRGAIALRIGMKTRALQLKKDRVTARNEARVARLYREVFSR